MNARNCTSFSPYATARALADIDADMRKPHGNRRAIELRVRFYETAIRSHAIRRLNTLGGLVQQSRLSERSLDVIFEDDRYVHRVIEQILAIADSDPSFAQAIVNQQGASILAYWRSRRAPDHFGQRMKAAA